MSAGRAAVLPDGKFDIDILVEELSRIESLRLKPTKVFLSPRQFDQMLKELANVGISYEPGRIYTIFDLPVEVDETKRHCLGIIEEF